MSSDQVRLRLQRDFALFDDPVSESTSVKTWLLRDAAVKAQTSPNDKLRNASTSQDIAPGGARMAEQPDDQTPTQRLHQPGVRDRLFGP